MKTTVFLATGLLLILALGTVIGCGGKSPTAPVDNTSGNALAPGVNGDLAANDKGETSSYVSSITVPNNDADNGAEDEAGEAARLSKLAKITSDQAAQAALAKVPGTVVKTELENENGNVVYGVEINTAAGTTDVKVDAGNGNVLHIDADDDGEGGNEVKGVEDDGPGGFEANHEFDGEEEGEH
ncbi:PepSY domain-containing protein [Candidatus Poribacteria bacterium]|nr:PepSY domain-containing protein [Candidatus Poribacteria bacterium]